MKKTKAYAVATAHLDTVWRWNIAQTIEEFIPDTLAKNFELIEKYPNYKFNFEGAYRYELIESFYPQAFKKVRKYIKDDRWCISGTAYENGDVNIPSPEALIRNLLYGHKYFIDKFGKSSKDIFLPDCFGFSWALPSVAAHCGLKGFTTQKLSWGCSVDLPFDLGIWRGPDGKGIFAAVNAGSYRHKFSGDVRGDMAIINRIAQNASCGELPWVNHLYGTGDKGGAPDEKSVEAIEKSVAKNGREFDVISAGSDQIFKDIDALNDDEKNKLPVWNSELLMTSHGAGAYTSRGMSKRLNRQNEQLAVATEKICALANAAGNYEYPKNVLEQAWKRVIRHQFHDDITGTSIMDAYNESWNDYYLSLSQFKNEYTGAGKVIISNLNTSFVAHNSTIVMINNPTQFKRKSVVEGKIRSKVNCSNIAVFDKNGKEYPSQVINKDGKDLTIAFQAELEGFEYKIYEIKPAAEPCKLKTDLKVTNHSLENSKYKLIFNKNGDIAYLFDKKLGRQIIDKPIKMALLKDTGSLAYPSWEITKEDINREPYCYANTPVFSVMENGPARISIKIVREAEHSVITQTVSLDTDSEYINVLNNVDWKTRRTLLKAVFPFAAHNEKATYDLGLGVIKRGNNTDRLYEVPAQKWADISDKSGNFGISVFSDCKYGWDKPADNTLRLTCIHTPSGAFTKETRQDLQDIGRNIFSFAIYSHSGGFENGTQKYSEIYANPIMIMQTDIRNKGEYENGIIQAKISDDEVLIRSIKMAEEDESIIVRVNEANGREHNNVRLSLFGKTQQVFETNGLEENIREIELNENAVSFNIKPFEVKTFKFVCKKQSEKASKEEYKTVNLPFNSKGFSKAGDEMKHIILQGSGLSLPWERLPQSNAIRCMGINFKLKQSPSDRYDVFVCRGQKLQLEGNYTRFYIIAGSTSGSQEIKVKVDNKIFPITIRPINEPTTHWDMAGLNQTAVNCHNDKLAFEFENTHHPEGIIPEKARFYLYSINIYKAKTIQFLENNRVVILAATQVNEIGKCMICNQIEDTVSKNYSFDDEIPPIDKIIDKADFVTIRAGKIQDQINGGKGKGLKRNNIITNIIRSYTKSEW